MKWQILKEWLIGGGERRQGARFHPALSAYYWSGEQVKPYPVRDISPSGLFIETKDVWGIGTSLQLHLQEADLPGAPPPQKTSVLTAIVRREGNGLAMTFLFENEKEQGQFDAYLAGVRGRRAQAGSALVEFALLLPLLFLLIVNAVNFGAFFYAWITMANAARSGSQYASLAGAAVNSPAPATATQIYNVVAQDIYSLPNRGSLAVRTCTNNGGTIACQQTGTGTFTNPAADPRDEANLFVMTWVDVQYTYQPLIPLFNFPALGIHATIPPTSIHRQTVMRRLQ